MDYWSRLKTQYFVDKKLYNKSVFDVILSTTTLNSKIACEKLVEKPATFKTCANCAKKVASSQAIHCCHNTFYCTSSCQNVHSEEHSFNFHYQADQDPNDDLMQHSEQNALQRPLGAPQTTLQEPDEYDY